MHWKDQTAASLPDHISKTLNTLPPDASSDQQELGVWGQSSSCLWIIELQTLHKVLKATDPALRLTNFLSSPRTASRGTADVMKFCTTPKQIRTTSNNSYSFFQHTKMPPSSSDRIGFRHGFRESVRVTKSGSRSGGQISNEYMKG